MIADLITFINIIFSPHPSPTRGSFPKLCFLNENYITGRDAEHVEQLVVPKILANPFAYFRQKFSFSPHRIPAGATETRPVENGHPRGKADGERPGE